DVAERLKFSERPSRLRDPKACDAHADVDDRRRKASAEQIELRKAELAIDQRVAEQRIRGDRNQRDPERRLRTIDRAHETADGDEPPAGQQAPGEPFEI